MANLFHRNPSQNQKGRNGFDMSQRRMFTSPCGMLLPCYSDFAVAGDKYKLNSRMFIRTEQLQSAAFCRLRGHLDWFFVPFKQLYMFWNEFYNMTNDVNTSLGQRAGTMTPRSSWPLFSVDYSSWFLSNVDDFLATHPYSVTDLNKPSADPISVKFANCDEFGIPYAWNFRRLHDMLYGSVEGLSSQNMNFITALAYHKIFYGHYRNTLYTPNDPKMYSADQFFNAPNGDNKLTQKLLSTIHYRPWRKDYFTCIQPAPIFGSSFASFLHPVDASVSGYSPVHGFPESSSIADSDILVSSQENLDSSVIGVSMPSGGSSTSVGDIRAMFALDKLLRVTASTGSHYDEQTLAHLGYKVPEGIADDPYYIGNQEINIDINEVVATATTGVTNDGSAVAGSVIGDIAGKGFGASSNSPDLDFTCPCDGVIMGIFSIEPLADYHYDSDGTEFYYSSFDFFHPELDNIGMQPFGYPYKVRKVSSPNTSTPLNIFLGWQYRYMQHKTKYDVSHESLYLTDKESWQASRDNTPTTFHNSLQNLFYISPQYTNSIFLAHVPFFTNYTGTGDSTTNMALNGRLSWSYGSFAPINGGFSYKDFTAQSVYQSDSFINVVDMKVYKTSIMSTYSLPNM